MAGVFICKVEHPKFGQIEVFETQNGARVYAREEEAGQITFQSRAAQSQLRGLVIKAGAGDKLTRPPTELEKANYLPGKVPEVKASSPEDSQGGETVSVTDDMPEQAPEVTEKPPGQKTSKGLFGGIFK